MQTKLVTLSFVNRSSYFPGHEPLTEVMVVEAAAAHKIAQWYGGYCGGDDYDVLIDGEIVEKDENGEIEPLA